MQVLGQLKIDKFIKKNRNAEDPLKSWLQEVIDCSLTTLSEIENKYKSADLLPNNRVVFHCIKGEFKLLTLVSCTNGIVIIEKIGTIAEYSKWNINW